MPFGPIDGAFDRWRRDAWMDQSLCLTSIGNIGDRGLSVHWSALEVTRRGGQSRDLRFTTPGTGASRSASPGPRPCSSDDVDDIFGTHRSSGPPSPTSTGSTTAASTTRSARSRRQNSKRATTVRSSQQRWRLHKVSMNPGRFNTKGDYATRAAFGPINSRRHRHRWRHRPPQSVVLGRRAVGASSRCRRLRPRSGPASCGSRP
jgi:hypothetical protein